MRRKIYRSFEEARKFARSLKLTSSIKWYGYCKSGKRPDDIPGNPSRIYKNKGWNGWGDWLGTGSIASQNMQYRPVKEAKEFVRKLKLKDIKEWKEYCKSGELPKNIPTNPNRTYKKEWKSWRDWLGNDKVTNQEKAKNRLPLREAGPIFKELEKKYGIKNRAGWTRFARTHKELLEKLHLPTEPWAVYPTKEEVLRRMKK